MSTSYGATQNQLGRLFDKVAETNRLIAVAFAARADAVWAAHRFSVAHAGEIPLSVASRWNQTEIAAREFSSELAVTLRIPERTAETLLVESRTLATDLPATRAALRKGRISYRHAQALLEQSWSIPAAGLPAFEAALLPKAETLTVAKLKHTARLLRERLHPETISSRRARSIGDRSSGTQPERDGMATLYLTTGAELVEAIFTRATGLATSLQGPGEARTLTQLRTDLLSDLLIDGVTPTTP